MDEFLKDRQVEHETYAIINYFKLLRQAETAEVDTYDSRYFPEDTFALIGGVDSFNRLLLDYREGYIDVFSNSIGNLFTKLEENINYINSVTFTKSTMVNKALQDFEIIKKFYSEIYSVNGNKDIAAIYDLIGLPLPRDMISQILEFRPKEKKIGER